MPIPETFEAASGRDLEALGDAGVAGGADPELVLEMALGYMSLAESITTINTPEDDAVRVVCAVRDAPGNALKHLLGAVAAAYDPEAGYDMPGTVIGEIHTSTDAFQWGAEAAWLEAYMAGDWGREELLGSVVKHFEDLETTE